MGRRKPSAPLYDLWDEKSGREAAPEIAAKAAAAADTASKRQKPPKTRSMLPPAVEARGAAPLSRTRARACAPAFPYQSPRCYPPPPSASLSSHSLCSSSTPFRSASQVCKPGASYNPAMASHQELLGEAVAVETIKAIKKELDVIKPPRASPISRCSRAASPDCPVIFDSPALSCLMDLLGCDSSASSYPSSLRLPKGAATSLCCFIFCPSRAAVLGKRVAEMMEQELYYAAQARSTAPRRSLQWPRGLSWGGPRDPQRRNPL